MDGNKMSDEMFELLLASLQDEQHQFQVKEYPWKGQLIDCGSIAHNDSSCCFWLCLYFHLTYIWKSPPNMPFADFKRELCKAAFTHKSATPEDIQRACININIPIRIVEVDGEKVYYPTPDYALPIGEHITLVLFDGHYQIWAMGDLTKREMLKKPYWEQMVHQPLVHMDKVVI